MDFEKFVILNDINPKNIQNAFPHKINIRNDNNATQNELKI